MTSHPDRPGPQHTTLVLLAILALGAALRLGQAGLIRYGYDQSYPAFQAVAWLDGGVLPLIGQPSSVFLDNPALMPYIQAIPLLLWRSPWSVQFFILALNTAAIWFVYRAAAEVLSEQAGLVAAFLFAVSPWVVFFSRTTWVQSLVPFFMAVAAWGLWPAFVNDHASPWRFFAGMLSVTLMTQTYVAAWGVLPQVILLLVIFRRRLPRRALLAAAIVFLATTAIYAIGLRYGQAASADKAANLLDGALGVNPDAARHALRLVNGLDFRAAYAADSPTGSLWPVLSALAVVLFSLALALGLTRAVLALRERGPDRRAAVILMIWLLTPVVLMLFLGGLDIHPHYLLLALPAGQALAAWGVVWAARGRATAAGLAALLLASGLIFAHDYYRANELVAEAPVWPQYDGWSLAAAATLGKEVRAWQTGTPGAYPRRVIAGGHRALLSGLSATYLEPVDGASYPGFILLDRDEPLLAIIDGAGALPDWLEPVMRPVPDGDVLLPNGSIFRLAALSAAERAESIVDHPLRETSTAGLTLAGYTLRDATMPDPALELVLLWRVDDLHPDRGDWFVASNAHLLDDRGGIVANVGEHGQWAWRWQLGDVYVERLLIPLAGTAAGNNYRLSIGLNDSVRGLDYVFGGDGSSAGRVEIPIPAGALPGAGG